MPRRSKKLAVLKTFPQKSQIPSLHPQLNPKILKSKGSQSHLCLIAKSCWTWIRMEGFLRHRMRKVNRGVRPVISEKDLAQ